MSDRTLQNERGSDACQCRASAAVSDGQEVALSGSFPLGIITNAESTQCTVQLAYGSRLTFYSDGLPEAQNEKGELLGLEGARRCHSSTRKPLCRLPLRSGGRMTSRLW